MADIFHRDDVRKLITGKYFLFFGDSNVRALYKDILTLFQHNKLIKESSLSRKLEQTFEGDALLHSVGLIKGRNYREHRIFTHKETIIEFFFITKCLCSDVSDTLREIVAGKRRVPDVIAINSTLWDVTRWGSKSVALFKENMNKLTELFKKCLPQSTLVIWLTTPPLIANVQGGFLIKEVEFLKHTMRFEAMEANLFSQSLFITHGYDVLDFHYYLRMNVHRRNADGIHWLSKAMRFMTNLLLTHICIAWGLDLPGRFPSLQLEKLDDDIENMLKDDYQQRIILPVTSLLEIPQRVNETRRVKVRDRLGASVVGSVNGYSQGDLRFRIQDSQMSNKVYDNSYTDDTVRTSSRRQNRSGGRRVYRDGPSASNGFGSKRYVPYERKHRW